MVKCFGSRVRNTCLSIAPSPPASGGNRGYSQGGDSAPQLGGVFPCPVLSWRVCDQAPDRWKGWGSEPGICVKELDSRKFPESAWPSLKVLSRSRSPLRRRLCLELFFFTMVISRGSHFIHSSNWVVNYGQDHNRWRTKKGAYLLWQAQRTSQHHQEWKENHSEQDYIFTIELRKVWKD